MNPSKAGRPAKAQLRCNHCRDLCAPRNGDWFMSKDGKEQQVFLCRKCEDAEKALFKRVYPIK